jgi:hypothetical protein
MYGMHNSSVHGWMIVMEFMSQGSLDDLLRNSGSGFSIKEKAWM